MYMVLYLLFLLFLLYLLLGFLLWAMLYGTVPS